MVIFLYYAKQRCVVCHLKFIPTYCRICKHRDRTVCPACHKYSTYHKREASKIA